MNGITIMIIRLNFSWLDTDLSLKAGSAGNGRHAFKVV
jgi:hypothetical protein